MWASLCDTNYINFKEIKTARYTSDCKNYYIHIKKEVKHLNDNNNIPKTPYK